MTRLDLMMMKAFGKYEEGKVVTFIDGNKQNCALENLRMATPLTLIIVLVDDDTFLSLKDRNFFKYSSTLSDKAYSKASLQRKAGLPVCPDNPVFGFICRLEDWIGRDTLLHAMDKVAVAQVVILGTGTKEVKEQVNQIKEDFGGMVSSGVVEFNSQFAHLISAGADYMMAPSPLPCGLIQHSMAYGTVPIVALNGGLVDTVGDDTTGDDTTGDDTTVKDGVTGIQMFAPMELTDCVVELEVEAVLVAMHQAYEVFGTWPFEMMRQNCMRQNLNLPLLSP